MATKKKTKKKPNPELRRRTIVAVALAILTVPIAGVVFVAVQNVLYEMDGALQKAAAERVPVDQVLTVTRRVERGEILTAELITSMDTPSTFIHECVRPHEPPVGVTAVEPLIPGECLRRERLQDARGAPGIQALIPRGMRALSANLDTHEMLSGFLVPGDHADVVVTLPSDTDEEGNPLPAETLTLLHGTRILATGTTTLPGERGGEGRVVPSVTMTVSPEDAEKVAQVLDGAKVRLVLRGEIDFYAPTDRAPTTTSALLGSASERLTVSEYRARVTPAELDRMILLFQGPEVVVERVVDPALIAPIAPPPPSPE